MLLHLASDEKFIDHVINVFEQINLNDNKYLIPSFSKKLKYVKSKNANIVHTSLCSDEYKRIINNLGQFDGIIVHNLYDEYKKEILTQLNKKIHVHWMSWGTDLYFIPQLRNNLIAPYTRKKTTDKKIPLTVIKFKGWFQWSFKNLANIYHLLKGNREGYYKSKQLIRAINSFSTVIPEESKFVFRYLSRHPIYLPFKYAMIKETNGDDDICKNSNFLIGNSATITNNHFDTFNELRMLRRSNLKFYTPLSYGNEYYAKIVIREGKLIFEDRFIPLTTYVSIDNYNKLLNNCGNVVMNHIRQQALGTILISLWKGARIFLNPKNPLYRFFIINGIMVFKIKDIKNIQNLPRFKVLAEMNRPKLLNMYGESNVLNETKMLVEYIKKQKSSHDT